MVKFNKAYF